VAEKKYAHCFQKAPLKQPRNPEVVQPIINMVGERDGGGANLVISRSWITRPVKMLKEPHQHDYDQFLIIAGSNPLDVSEFDAEMELTLGTEGETHTVTEPTLVHIPPGTMHGPLNFKRVGKPVEFLDIFLHPAYIRKTPDGRIIS
jgi:hypothetical protein